MFHCSLPIGNLPDVADNTAGLSFLLNITTLIIKVFETTLWYIVELATAILLIPLTAVMLLLDLVEAYSPVKRPEKDLSAVNRSTPNLLTKYIPNYDRLEEILVGDVQKIESLDDVSIGDIDTAVFFLMLASVVYERNRQHDHILSKWGLLSGATYRFMYTNGSCSTLIHREFGSKQELENGEIVDNRKLFIALSFKGTSPFDLNGWLTDANMQRNQDQTELLTQFGFSIGQTVSDGFYKALLAPPGATGMKTAKYGSPLQEISHKFASLVEEFKNSKHGEFDPTRDVHFWVTGHSLGAALSTTFTTVLMCNNAKASKQLGLMRSTLRGVYTFGNPKVCTEDCSTEINNALVQNDIPFRRIRNGNDIVGAIPIGHGVFENLLKDMRVIVAGAAAGEITSPIEVDSISDFGTIGKEFRLGYSGEIIEPIHMLPYQTPSTAAEAFKNIRGQAAFSAKKFVSDVITTLTLWLQAWFVYWPISFVRMFNVSGCSNSVEEVATKTTFATWIMQTLAPGFLFDHITANYARNLYICKSKLKSRPRSRRRSSKGKQQ